MAKKPENLEFDNLGKKKLEKPGIREILKITWNFVQKLWKNLEFRTKIMEKPGIFLNLNVLTILINK